MKRGKYVEEKEQLMTLGGGSIMVRACMAASGKGSLVFIEAKIGRHITVQMDNDLKHTTLTTQDFQISA